MTHTGGQPDPDIRTEPLEATDPPAPEPDARRDADEVEAARPRPDKDPETQEDTASGGPAD
ncbi:hypothetical protein HII28_09645 [Planctomonas sp. JC2975]|uniref:hypothetical protein n=1 Tax=Planctomonas sp. JC2975 TaxID=2729626 RepID=UPI001474F8A6|nr:hypothetical protein [Planctomonas sp. JC2975]NNC12138.1 hypothetical protein [Planctomonas sp. JC2975]